MARRNWPSIVVGAILAFISWWNNFIFGAVSAGRTTRTMPVAAAIVVMLPAIVPTFVIQKEIVQRLSAGGVKQDERELRSLPTIYRWAA